MDGRSLRVLLLAHVAAAVAGAAGHVVADAHGTPALTATALFVAAAAVTAVAGGRFLSYRGISTYDETRDAAAGRAPGRHRARRPIPADDIARVHTRSEVAHAAARCQDGTAPGGPS